MTRQLRRKCVPGLASLCVDRKSGRTRIKHSSGRSLRLERLEERTLLTAGALDLTFGIGGMVTTDFGFRQPTVDTGYAVQALQVDGKIVVAGTANVHIAVACTPRRRACSTCGAL